ncbi:MAG: histidine phosphatase family protein, partial [Mesorhizobium sp.]
MSALPEIYLVRHGETEWSASGKHTGLTDIPLTPAGEEAAGRVAERLQGLSI